MKIYIFENIFANENIGDAAKVLGGKFIYCQEEKIYIGIKNLNANIRKRSYLKVSLMNR